MELGRGHAGPDLSESSRTRIEIRAVEYPL